LLIEPTSLIKKTIEMNFKKINSEKKLKEKLLFTKIFVARLKQVS